VRDTLAALLRFGATIAPTAWLSPRSADDGPFAPRQGGHSAKGPTRVPVLVQ